MPKIKKLAQMWICSNEDRFPYYHTIACTKKESIAKFIDNSSMDWKECRKYGNDCNKVNITFEINN
jgi:hypothetical protein